MKDDPGLQRPPKTLAELPDVESLFVMPSCGDESNAIANPQSVETVRTLNRVIKGRDFWMPFAPSVLSEDAPRYIANPRQVEAAYMSVAFDATEAAKRDIPAALHPYDFTMRPQVVSEAWNPDFHRVISGFKALTGVGAVLNTSFNLHGEPNVLTPEDALHTVEQSGLRFLALGRYLLEKRTGGPDPPSARLALRSPHS